MDNLTFFPDLRRKAFSFTISIMFAAGFSLDAFNQFEEVPFYSYFSESFYHADQIFFNLFYLFLAALGLRCCAQAFSSCGERGLLRCGAWASHCGGLSCCRAQALGVQASVVAAGGLSSCGAWT